MSILSRKYSCSHLRPILASMLLLAIVIVLPQTASAANFGGPWSEAGDTGNLVDSWAISGANDTNTDNGVLYWEYSATQTLTGYGGPWTDNELYNRFSAWFLAGVTSSNSDNGILYIQVGYADADIGMGIAKNSAMTQYVAAGNNGNTFWDQGTISINSINGSGISGSFYYSVLDGHWLDSETFILTGTAQNNTSVTASIFKDSAKTQLVARGTASVFGEVTLTEQNDSGLSGSVTTNGAGTDNDIGNTLTGTIQQQTSTTTILSSTNPSTYGSPITLTATVTSGATGTIQFQDDETDLGSPVAISSGIATYTTSSLAEGSHSLTAVYSGDTNYSGSTSNTVTQTVNPPPTDPSPVVSEVTPVPTPTSDATPSYTFNSTAEGTITYGGDCSSSTTSAISGNNTITFTALAAGVHSNCTIMVTDLDDNQSNVLSVSSFTISISQPESSIAIGGLPFDVAAKDDSANEASGQESNNAVNEISQSDEGAFDDSSDSDLIPRLQSQIQSLSEQISVVLAQMITQLQTQIYDLVGQTTSSLLNGAWYFTKWLGGLSAGIVSFNR